MMSNSELSLEEQKELLHDLKSQNFKSARLLENIKDLEKKIYDLQTLDAQYHLSIEDYFSNRWNNGTGKVFKPTEMYVTVRQELEKLPEGPLLKVLSAAFVHTMPLFAILQQVDTWMIVCNYYIAFIFDGKQTNVFIRIRDLDKIVDNLKNDKLIVHHREIDSTGISREKVTEIRFDVSDAKEDKISALVRRVNSTLSEALLYKQKHLCPVCGDEIDLNAMFCGNCGYKLK